MEGGFIHMNPSEIDSSSLNGIYNEIANLLGIDAAIEIHASYHGQQITFPVNFFKKEFIDSQIIKEYNGANTKQLATKYNYSEKWIRKIIKGNKNGEDK